MKTYELTRSQRQSIIVKDLLMSILVKIETGQIEVKDLEDELMMLAKSNYDADEFKVVKAIISFAKVQNE